MKVAGTRIYSMSDADLCQFASDLVGTMTRDILEFTPKGVTALQITAFQTLGNAFEVFPNDDFYLADVLLATDTKNAKRASLEIKLRDILGLAILKWGVTSPQVKRFSASTMTKDSDRVFLTIIRQGVTVATSYLVDLTPLGLTQLQIDALEDEGQEFEDALNDIAEKEMARDIKTRERIDKGNELYGFVSKYCEMGKFIWQDVDPAKYNDYVIYELSPGVPLKIQNMAFAAISNTISWTADPTATSYELVFSLDTPTRLWVQLYQGPNTSFVHVYGPSTMLYKCRGLNDNGYGYWSDELIVTRP